MFEDKVVHITKFVAPEIIFGLGALSQVGDSVLRLGARKVFVVTDEGVSSAGWVDTALDSLKEVGIEYECYSDSTSNPKDVEVASGVEAYRLAGCDAVLAVGGGSPIDVAKAVAAVASNGGRINDYEGVNRIIHPLPPMVVVPTTAGSGSEVSQFAMIVDTNRKVKMTIISKSLVPDIALIDPVVLQTKDAELTAVTGMDALSHAIEAYTSLAATPLTDVHAIEALQTIANNLRSSVASRTNLKAKSAMAMASLQAGLAFSNAILGATHAMTHQVDGLLDLHHGKTNAVLLPYVMEFNMIASTDKFVRIAEAFGECVRGMSSWAAAERAVHAVRRLTRDIGIPKNLTALGLNGSYIPQLVKSALNDACLITNPRDVEEEDLTEIFRKAL
ncbi:iron-containing alcohol dehydrogenase [Desulfofarcimen acetoxidans DSM 771]|uniref:Iron-containing alcohol dehydrogenase n=1 Tax=Desulfofarcimen acetoxidans (strain ATCC 49208 / DSM 771 / KCTC 5769 / VKM B-1644 / 5575) TaxID=485916 RepID=C8W2N2_DESAS|nr:iron-containing alcohol dehydrogenase [Desulfofarcimen acetoxidans]ACV63716.1 iron-containing alcohol dehydrogenase [Desulfofarcimen acetoxidans DSM 771]